MNELVDDPFDDIWCDKDGIGGEGLLNLEYECVVCREKCEQAPTKSGWFSLSGLRAIHFACLEHLWDVYRAMGFGKNEGEGK